MNIIKKRKSKGFTQRKLAIEVGVSVVTIQNWESGITTPTEENMAKLIRALEVK